ncbi:Nitrogen regulatory protein-PII [Methanocella conradii HZ254]|uniref:Nitrogen regulatory protein-PII n=1 Tax=Methanocella conradii (strain DSM 24694 / JCM 17849 / CGMCC 1.5162 / HZ254) TaxID=1041930 RepID=H8I6M3_METCZ|nr:P-II family nitrogen regulator [Methanocella conradii]AFC98915.1 Nitrogen regulatory protein-PII [Methanocella conradii HZ254]MDI6898107.1 P-II family nitrogen regulator [Methanocella conradii]
MKEIMAIVRMNKAGATKKALINAGVAGFTAVKVLGRGRLVTDPEVIAKRKAQLMSMSFDDVTESGATEKLVTDFLDGTRLFPRRLFTILAHDEDVPRIVEAIMQANRTDCKVGDGKIFVLPMLDAVRVRTGESGDAAIW